MRRFLVFWVGLLALSGVGLAVAWGAGHLAEALAPSLGVLGAVVAMFLVVSALTAGFVVWVFQRPTPRVIATLLARVS